MSDEPGQVGEQAEPVGTAAAALPGIETAASVCESAARLSIAEFLERVPPNQPRKIKQVVQWREGPHGRVAASALFAPEIQLHCDDKRCGGVRFFRQM